MIVIFYNARKYISQTLSDLMGYIYQIFKKLKIPMTYKVFQGKFSI